ncbi:P-loop containing nucleoside triphosphate hydrolase protein [Plenodomus tracheiphilus IPT5]|uniref:P-loop containing nucleoside triphosphate hydrolase protein n=1 Tax=Plenodomus tracheiphilus IPT5 TaxID=1408161 RepID=A0A6A7AN17_9PLEO|nr:P-loop containing nucleoside triphosphate hydrolase protein [Plenodomus tracheiphilus IPT5]
MNDFSYMPPPPPVVPFHLAHLTQPCMPYSAPPPPRPRKGRARPRHSDRNDNNSDSGDGFMGDEDNLHHEDLEEAVLKGERCDSKDMYRVPRADDPDKFHWVEEPPLQYGSTTEPGKTKKAREAFAVNVYRRYNESKEEWYVSELRLNSTLLHTALETVLEGYPGLTQHELKSFSPPFLPFLHRWDALQQFTDELDAESETKQHLLLLQQILVELLKESFDTIKDTTNTGHIAFEDVQLLYVPGTIVFRQAPMSAAILRKCHVKREVDAPDSYEIFVDVVEWNGRSCGLVTQLWKLDFYYGLRALTALSVAPLNSLPDEQAIRTTLTERGRLFEKYRSQSFLAFTSQYDDRINERVIVDAKTYYKFDKGAPKYASLAETGQLTWAQSMNRHSAGVPIHPSMMPPPHPSIAPIFPEICVDEEPVPMTDEQCLLAIGTMPGFHIDNKKWEDFDVTKLHEIPWSERAFENLVLEQTEKDLILALVDRDQYKTTKPFDDFIAGKGEGMIMLLCGPPGVGKTLTAETVSEHLRRPLYRLGASELGSDPRVVEAVLHRALKLCAEFGAVLLIDEADVFMGARSSFNLIRDELVATFLRLLEYYSGIMILTTNRMSNIDPAFESRIDITLTYESLSETDRKQVWRNFIATMDPKEVNIDEYELSKLAKRDFNGRQIKSAIKTARILAAKKNEPLNARHLAVVLNLRRKAMNTMVEKTENFGGTGRVLT